MAVVNPEKISAILSECADLYVLPRYKALGQEDVFEKTSAHDLVTKADIDVEAHLKRVLPDMLPGSIVIGEEGVSNGEQSLDALRDSDQKMWIVDPVDGTYNFVHNNREFGIMLALIIGGETAGAWIYDVLGAVCAIAEKGSGVFLGGERQYVSNSLYDASALSGHVNPKYFHEAQQEHVKTVQKEFKKCFSFGCSAHEYLNIIQGNTQFSVYSKLMPWDHLPGALMVQEAGGYVAKWDGQPYQVKDLDAGLISANSKDTWMLAHDAFVKKVQAMVV